MRLAVWLGLALVTGGAAWGQTPDVSAARQNEIARLAPLYSIDLTHGDWQHEPAAICPAFRRHAFVYYHRSAQPGVRTSFMAVLPVHGGSVMLAPIAGEVDPKAAPVASNKSTHATFNAIFADELHHTGDGSTIPGLTWSGLAKCYAGFVGEQPVETVGEFPDTPEEPIDLRKQKVFSILIPVASPGSGQRSVWVQMDAQGMIADAGMSETKAAK